MNSLYRIKTPRGVLDNVWLLVLLVAVAASTVASATLLIRDASRVGVVAAPAAPAQEEVQFDYFPAQFPAPSGEIEALPPTF